MPAIPLKMRPEMPFYAKFTVEVTPTGDADMDVNDLPEDWDGSIEMLAK